MAQYLIQRIIQSFSNGNETLQNDLPDKFRSFVGITAQQLSITKTNIYGYSCYNPNAVDVFLKFYNFIPTIGITVPIWTVQIPSLNSVVLQGSEVLFNGEVIHVAITTGYLDSDIGVPPIDSLIQITYK